VDETGSGFCPLADFGISGLETSVFATSYLHSFLFMYFIYLVV
jgi:hypothetical protein